MLRLPTLLVLMGLLLGCGFHPRGELPDKVKDKRVAITGVDSSVNLYNLFIQRLKVAGGKIANKTADAAVVVHVIRQRHIRRPITLSAVGRANMFDLNYLVVYEIHDNKGHIISKARELLVRREYFNTQASPLGQQSEEQTYRTEMESDAASVLFRQVMFSIENAPETPSEITTDQSKPQAPEPMVNGSMQP